MVDDHCRNTPRSGLLPLFGLLPDLGPLDLDLLIELREAIVSNITQRPFVWNRWSRVMRKYILAIDQGTTATTALVVGSDLSVLGRASFEIPQIYPKPGYVEHDPEAIWQATVQAAKGAIERAEVKPSDCVAIGITNQRETTILWDRASGKPRHNAVVWQCRRTLDICKGLKEQGLESFFRQRTGLVLDPYFSGTKVTWLLENVRGLRQDAEAGRVAFGTVDSFLLYRLTGGRKHATDPSNASRTLLFDIHTLSWDHEILRILGVPEALLPEVLPSAGLFGTTSGLDFLPDGIPITGIAGDQQAALFGQTCFEPGQSKCTFGTGAFILVNTGEQPVPSDRGLLTTVAWRIGSKVCYALEGSAFVAGAAVQWLRDGLGLIRASADIEVLAASVPDSGGVVFVPALAGLGAPYWRPEARGAFFGLTRAANAGHIARAVLEGIALQVRALVAAMEADMGTKIAELRVDGGASANNLLMQFQADILAVPVVRPQNLDTTAIGAALLAGIGANLFSMDGLKRLVKIDRKFEPTMSAEERKTRVERFEKAVAAICSLHEG